MSVGISVHPDNGSDAEVLIDAADYAMYQAKRQGRNAWRRCPEGPVGPAASEGGGRGARSN